MVTPDYPRLICDTWLGLPDNLDAAFTYKNNNQIVFFKGAKYWQFTGTKRDKGYPRLIKDGFPGIPDNIQAATIWGKTNYIYFFKGNIVCDIGTKPICGKSDSPHEVADIYGISHIHISKKKFQ